MIILFIVVLLINAGWYLNEERQTWDLDHITTQEAARYQKKYLKRVEKLSPQEAYAFLEKQSNTITDYITLHSEQSQSQDAQFYQKFGELDIVDQLMNQMSHLGGYQDYLEGIRQQAGVMSTISIFKKEGSFANKNIAKTVQNYKSLEGISLERGTNQPIVGTLFDPMLRLLNIIFIFAIVLSFIEERKCGLWEKVHTTVEGRGKLAVRRGLILLVSTFMVQIITLFERLVISSYLYGDPDFGRKIQSIPEFKDFVFPMSITSYLIFYWILCSLAGFCLGLFLWLVLSIFLNRVLSFALICIVEVVEWVAYAYIPVQSWVGFLKYFNLYYLINPTKQLAAYSNISFFGQPVERLQILLVSLVLLSSLFFVLAIRVNQRKKPVQIPNHVERIVGSVINTIGNKIRKVLAKLSIGTTEWYKIFGPQKGWLILLVTILYLVSGYQKHDIFFGGEQNVLNEFYADYNGKLDKKALARIDEMALETKKSEDSYAKSTADYAAGKISSVEMDNATWVHDSTTTMRGAYAMLQTEVERLENLKQKRNIEPWLVNGVGYSLMLGERGFPRQFRRAMLEVFILILVLSAIFSQERSFGTKIKIRTTKKGRLYFFQKKIEVIVVYSLLMNILIWGYEWLYYSKNFPLHNLRAPIQSIAVLESIPINCSIAGFFALLFLARWMLIIAVGNVISFLSTRFTQVGTLSIATILFLGPAALSLLGISVLEKISVITPIAMMGELLEPWKRVSLLAQFLILIVVGIIALFIGCQQWCQGGIEHETGN